MEFKGKLSSEAVLWNEAAKGRSSYRLHLQAAKRILNVGDLDLELPIYVPFVKRLFRNLPAVNIL